MTIGVDPQIGQIGPVMIEWHGVMMSLGIVVGFLLTFYLARRDKFPTENILPAIVWAVVGGLIGARISHVIDTWEEYSDHLPNILAIWQGGLGWYGGLIGGVLATILYCKLKHFSASGLLDKSAPGVMLGLAIGRIGCTINGDAFGTRTSLPWGLTYTHDNAFVESALMGVPTHPAAIYEILWLLVVVGITIWLRNRLKPEWSNFLVMIALYSFGRFFISWSRGEPAVLGPLHQSHVISLLMFFSAVTILVIRKVHFEQPSDSDSEPSEKSLSDFFHES